jgi:hypothetical protein
MHRTTVLVPSILALCAALATACSSSSSSSCVDRLKLVLRDDHLVAVAYRAESKSQGACVTRIRTHAITSDRDAAQCFSDGLTASGLERSLETFRRQVLDAGRHGDDGCRRAAGTLAALVAREAGYIHASRQDLARRDAKAYSDDGMRAGEMAAREADPSDALVRACASG